MRCCSFRGAGRDIEAPDKLAYYLKPVAKNYDKTQQQQQHHFPQIFIPQNTPSENSAFRKVHLPEQNWP